MAEGVVLVSVAGFLTGYFMGLGSKWLGRR